MRGLSSLNSGEERYLVNSASQSAASRGGKEPVTGLHSVMLSPDSVSRVSPPNTTIPKTLAALPSSQYATLFSDVSGKYFALLFVPESRKLLASPNVEVIEGLDSSSVLDLETPLDPKSLFED